MTTRRVGHLNEVSPLTSRRSPPANRSASESSTAASELRWLWSTTSDPDALFSILFYWRRLTSHLAANFPLLHEIHALLCCAELKVEHRLENWLHLLFISINQWTHINTTGSGWKQAFATIFWTFRQNVCNIWMETWPIWQSPKRLKYCVVWSQHSSSHLDSTLHHLIPLK